MEHEESRKHLKLEDANQQSSTKIHAAPIIVVCPGMLTKNLHKKLKYGRKSTLRETTSRTSQIRKSSTVLLNLRQASFELNFKQMDLTEYGKKRIEEEVPEYLKFSWKFLTYDRSSIVLSYVTGMDMYAIESTELYDIDLDGRLFEYIVTREIKFELYATKNETEVYIASGTLPLKDLVEDPSGNISASIDMCDADKAKVLGNSETPISYGNLSLAYRLNGPRDTLENFVKRYGHFYYSSSKLDLAIVHRNEERRKFSSVVSAKEERSSQITYCFSQDLSYEATESSDNSIVNSLEPTESEVEGFQEALLLVLSRNKALRTTQSDISNELKDRTDWLREESNWRRTLQEFSILQGRNPDEVEWRQWRDNDTAEVKLRIYKSDVTIYKPEVRIVVLYLKFKRNPPRYKQFYVEYSFLSHEGIEMESPYVKASENGTKMVINFKKVFRIDDKRNLFLLANCIKNKEDIRFSIVGEPAELHDYPPCCEEVCWCTFNLFRLVQEKDNELSLILPLYSSKEEKTQQGYLEVSVHGIQAMRAQALKILAPPEYNTYQ